MGCAGFTQPISLCGRLAKADSAPFPAERPGYPHPRYNKSGVCLVRHCDILSLTLPFPVDGCVEETVLVFAQN